MFKKIVWLIMFITLFLQMGGLWTSLKIQQGLHRWEMLEYIESNPENLVKIKMSIKEYESCLIESDEILWQGEMYDVKAKTLQGQTIELLAFPDKEEDKILNNLTRLEEEQSSRKESETLLDVLTKMTYIQPKFKFQLIVNQHYNEACFRYIFKKEFNYTRTLHGPPKC